MPLKSRPERLAYLKEWRKKHPGYGQKKRLCIDHDHTNGKFRGLLCTRCNAGIGLLGDTVESLQKAVAYLQAA